MSIVAMFLKDKITSIFSTTSDEYNDKTETVVYSNIPCRWENQMLEKAKVSGIQKEFSIRCWILPRYIVKSGYRFLFEGVTYEVVGFETYANVFGQADHTVVYLGAFR
jgi:hypothetical protein